MMHLILYSFSLQIIGRFNGYHVTVLVTCILREQGLPSDIVSAVCTFRDVFWQGTCDDGCYALADALGWGVS